MNNFRHSGERVEVLAAAARTSGSIVADLLYTGGTTVAGIATSDAATGQRYWIAVRGVFKLTVPNPTTAGQLLYVPGSGPTAGNALVLTATSSSNTLFGKALTPSDANSIAQVLVFEPRY